MILKNIFFKNRSCGEEEEEGGEEGEEEGGGSSIHVSISY